MASSRRNPYYLLGFLKRKEGITREEFSEHWRGPHVDLAMSLNILKPNIDKYEQGHVNDRVRGFLPRSEWDGVAILEGESPENLLRTPLSDEDQSRIVRDQEVFTEPQKSLMFVGEVITFIG